MLFQASTLIDFACTYYTDSLHNVILRCEVQEVILQSHFSFLGSSGRDELIPTSRGIYLAPAGCSPRLASGSSLKDFHLQIHQQLLRWCWKAAPPTEDQVHQLVRCDKSIVLGASRQDLRWQGSLTAGSWCPWSHCISLLSRYKSTWLPLQHPIEISDWSSIIKHVTQ